MAVVITVAQQKGGAGKTMLAASLAAAMAPHRRVALLDIDPQRSLARWHALREPRGDVAALTFSDVSGWRLGGEIERLRREHDVLIVDTPPVVNTDAKIAVRVADLVLIPVQPSPPDLWAAEGTLALAAGEKRPTRLVLNRASGTGKLRTAIEAELASRGLARLEATLGNRVAFAAAFAQGLGITETAPRSAAGQECAAVVAEVEGIVGIAR